MADGGCNGNDVVELESMRKDSFSWHPCQVSLSSTGLGLIVQYEDTDLEETIVDKEGVPGRIRVRSTPLQGDDCSSIQPGDMVLATRKSHVKGVFYDARVEEATRVRHSKRIHCRCSFTIKWLHQDLEGDTFTVLASAIMKLDTKSINLHPTISAFFAMLESSSAIDTLPLSTDVDGMDWEMDINVLLGRQIEEISNSTDVFGKKNSQKFVFGLKVDLNEQTPDREIDSSLGNPCVIIPLLSNLEGSTGSENKQPMETSMANSPLNPLAARAALASLRSQSAQLSSQSNVEKGDITSERSATKLQSGSKCIFSTVGHSSVTDDFSLKMQAALSVKCATYEGIVKTLFPSQSSSPIAEVSIAPSRSPVKGMGKKNQNSEKTIHPSGTRVTRAQAQKNIEMHESTQITETKEIQLRTSSKTRRATRSTVDAADKIELKEANDTIEENVPTKLSKLNSSAKNITALQNCLSDNNKPILSPFQSETSTPSAEIEENLLETDGVIIKVDSEKGTFADGREKHFNSKRLTRSAARQEAEKCFSQPKRKMSKSKFNDTNELNFSEAPVTPEKNRLEVDKSVSLPTETKISTHFTEERKKNREKSPQVKTTSKSSESVVSSNYGIKRRSASSNKEETRSSPRLKLVPRTRSQCKA
ncbi:hypothetical protein ACJIZ3_024139 [Penstemon smallii]|uniref:SAWADEE domain-containing protein n=1 Tax=Penstemon smallii TaxID=265156 RepID=A0ABD3TTH5_9LAMI